MKPKTEELLYFLLWSCERLCRPTFRNLTDSFEGWAYRNGFHRQLAQLERLQFLEARAVAVGKNRVYRLTEAGRMWALGGRDPEACWRRHWDGCWRMVLFDVPVGQDSARNKLRAYLRNRGFGYLQNSVWITPDPLANERRVLAGGTIDVECLILLEAKPCSGESDAQIVAGAWDFEAVNERYAKHLEILQRLPHGTLNTDAAAKVFHQWSRSERQAWEAAVSLDPLLPACLLPPSYLGRQAWKKRRATLAQAAAKVHAFRGIVEV